MISFSGGRTSAYLLRRILDVGIRSDVHVLFANTGKEREETLAFVLDCETRWNVPIHRIEYVPPPVKGARRDHHEKYREVSHANLSRSGEPFAALTRLRRFLPNPAMRMCTTELKIRPMAAWMRAHGYDHWSNVVGLRADEPKRVARMRAQNDEGKNRWDVLMPLARAGVTRSDVRAFWSAAPFDLRLRSWEGNCDLCFMKNRPARLRYLQDNPGAADWWAEREREAGATFQGKREPGYDWLAREAKRLPLVQPSSDPEDHSIDCFCTD